MRLELTPEAIDDLVSLDDASLGYGAKELASDLVLSAAKTLAEFPYWGPPASDVYLARRGFRKLICSSYVAIYRVDEKDGAIAVRIYRVFHQRSDYAKKIVSE